MFEVWHVRHVRVRRNWGCVMSLGLYSCNDTYGARVLVLFDNPDNFRDGQVIVRVDGEEDADGDLRLYFESMADHPRHEYPTSCTDRTYWRMLAPLEVLRTRQSLARDEGVLLSILTVFFVGNIDLEHVDSWLDKKHEWHEDGLDRFPRDHIVAEPFASYNSIMLREIILSNYEIALMRLKELGGVS